MEQRLGRRLYLSAAARFSITRQTKLDRVRMGKVAIQRTSGPMEASVQPSRRLAGAGANNLFLPRSHDFLAGRCKRHNYLAAAVVSG
jgi:hypothetical protein